MKLLLLNNLTLLAQETPSEFDLIQLAQLLVAAITGGLIPIFIQWISNRKDEKNNKRDNRSEIEKSYTEHTKDVMDSYGDVLKTGRFKESDRQKCKAKQYKGFT